MKSPRPFAVLFDLDGTLIDSIGLLLECVHHAFEGRTPAPTDAEWVATIGTPLRKQLAAYIDSDEDLDAVTSRYRTFQRVHHDRLTTAYPGVVETLNELHRRGHPIGSGYQQEQRDDGHGTCLGRSFRSNEDTYRHGFVHCRTNPIQCQSA